MKLIIEYWNALNCKNREKLAKILTIVTVPDKIRNSLFHVKFRSSAHSPDLFGPFANSRNVSGSSCWRLHFLRYLRIFPHVTKFYFTFTCSICPALLHTGQMHHLPFYFINSALILYLYLNLCFEAVTLRQAFLPKSCKLLLCPAFLISLAHSFVLNLTAQWHQTSSTNHEASHEVSVLLCYYIIKCYEVTSFLSPGTWRNLKKCYGANLDIWYVISIYTQNNIIS
jgi:hypothetical protein